MLPLFARFIASSKTGRRLKSNGTRIRFGTVKQYRIVHDELKKFSEQKNFPLRMRKWNKLTTREKTAERNYWKRFYRLYTDYLFSIGCFDNYTGTHIKIIRTFFYYVKTELGIDAGDYRSFFYVRNENIPIIVLSNEQLQMLIHDTAFENSLPDFLKRTKDIFVFGCTTALRFSDLMRLTKRNLDQSATAVHIGVRSLKTNTDTRIKLPDYAVAIIEKYAAAKTLLPAISNARLNRNVKLLCERAGWTYEVGKTRERRGVQKKITRNGKCFRFCDLITTHTMRRTAITTLLNLGMTEVMVRKISGHQANSKEFYKYVNFSQPYIDNELDRVYKQLNSGFENNTNETN